MYVCLPVKRPITFVRAAAAGLHGRDAVFLQAALLGFVENREVVPKQEVLLEACKYSQGKLKLRPLCSDLSVCVPAYRKCSSRFVCAAATVCET